MTTTAAACSRSRRRRAGVWPQTSDLGRRTCRAFLWSQSRGREAPRLPRQTALPPATPPLGCLRLKLPVQSQVTVPSALRLPVQCLYRWPRNFPVPPPAMDRFLSWAEIIRLSARPCLSQRSRRGKPGNAGCDGSTSSPLSPRCAPGLSIRRRSRPLLCRRCSPASACTCPRCIAPDLLWRQRLPFFRPES